MAKISINSSLSMQEACQIVPMECISQSEHFEIYIFIICYPVDGSVLPGFLQQTSTVSYICR